MFSHDPHCRRCGVLTWLTASGDGLGTKNLTKEQYDTMATIGHRYSKFDDRRYTESAENKKYELICHKCNQDEADCELAQLPIEEKWERSKAYPKDHPMSIANQQNKHK